MNVFHPLRTWCGFFLSMLVVGLAGCGSDTIGYVEGTVTLDDQPLEGALVTFIPEEGGRPAYGRTNADGWYELTYTRKEKGALIGTNSVEINTESEGDPDAENPAFRKSVPERIPAKYNVNTELTAEVESGSNTFNFDLSSEGEIISQDKLIEMTSDE